MDILSVTFTVSNTVAPEKQKAFTSYEIEIISMSTTSWVIYKRYNDFYNLHQLLLKYFSNKNKDDTNLIYVGEKILQKLPEIPPKRLTRSLAVEFVEKRKSELQDYLRKLLRIPEVLGTEILKNFLTVPDSVIPLLPPSPLCSSNNVAPPPPPPSNKFAQADMGSNTYHYNFILDSTNENKFFPGGQNYNNFVNLTPEERKVADLLQTLKSSGNSPRFSSGSSNKAVAIHEFSEWFFENRPHFSPECIKALLQGDKSAYKMYGLIQSIGDLEYSRVVARAALQLLVQLLDLEKNKEASLYYDIITKEIDHNVLLTMNLHRHADKDTRAEAFNIVSVLNTEGKVPIEVLLPDNSTGVRSEYLQWKGREKEFMFGSQQSDSQQNYFNPKSTGPLVRNYNDINIDETVKVLFDVQRDERGWREVEFNGSSMNNEKGIHLCYKKNIILDLTVIRLTCGLLHSNATENKSKANPTETLFFKLLELNDSHSDWDKKCLSSKLLTKLSNNSDIIQVFYKTPYPNLYKNRDFILLRKWFFHPDSNSYVITFNSTIYPSTAKDTHSTRGVMINSGYILQPCKICYETDKESNIKKETSNSATILTYIAQLDPEGVMIYSSDLLGEKNDLIGNYMRLSEVLNN